MRKTADDLDKIQTSIENAYTERGKVDKNKLKEYMENETWFTGEEAIKNGFADKIEDGKKINAKIKDNKIYINNQEIKTDRFKAFPKEKINFQDKGEPIKNTEGDNTPDNNTFDEMLEYESINNEKTLILKGVE